jgi:hypothetical protein
MDGDLDNFIEAYLKQKQVGREAIIRQQSASDTRTQN